MSDQHLRRITRPKGAVHRGRFYMEDQPIEGYDGPVPPPPPPPSARKRTRQRFEASFGGSTDHQAWWQVHAVRDTAVVAPTLVAEFYSPPHPNAEAAARQHASLLSSGAYPATRSRR